MLYNFKDYNSNQTNQKQDKFIFDAQIYNEDIAIKDIAALELFYQKNKYIPQKYLNLFLNYLVYYARKNVTIPYENPLTSSYKAKCSLVANIFNELLTKMNFKFLKFNIGDIFSESNIHELCLLYIPTKINDQIEDKLFILDPTFRQFCTQEENRFERYFEEERYSVHRATPHPGYFLKLHEEGTILANNLIKYGYFEATNSNLKTYFDSFYYYLKKKEDYEKDNLGQEFSSLFTGNYYLNKILTNSNNNLIKPNFEVQTPCEIVDYENKKLKNRLKIFFTKEDKSSNLDLNENKNGFKK